MQDEVRVERPNPSDLDINKLLEDPNLTEGEREGLRKGMVNPDAFQVTKPVARDTMLTLLDSPSPVGEDAEAIAAEVARRAAGKPLSPEDELGIEKGTAEAADEKPPAPTPCRCCGWSDPSAEPYAITDEDKRNWLRAVFHGAPFTKSFQIYAGRATIDFQLQPRSVRRAIFEQVQSEIARSGVAGDLASTVLAQSTRMLQLGLVTSIRRLPHKHNLEMPLFHPAPTDIVGTLVAAGVIESTPEVAATAIQMRKAGYGWAGIAHELVFADIDEALYGSLAQAYTHFENLMNRLRRAASSPDFWEGIELPA